MAIPLLSVLFSLISMTSLGFAVGMAKLPAITVGVKRLIFWRQLFSSSLLLAVLAVLWQTVNVSWFYIGFTLLLSFLSYIALLAANQALKTGVVGVVAPITASSVIVTVAVSASFFGEFFSAGRLAAAALTIIGIILFAVEFKNLRHSSMFNALTGVPHALLACLIWGTVYAFYKIPIAAIGSILTAFLIESGNLAASIPTNLLTKTTFKIPDKKTFFGIFLIGILAAISTLFYSFGLQAAGNNVGIVAVIFFCNPVVATIYGLLAYKEKLNTKQWLALALIIAGIIGISLL